MLIFLSGLILISIGCNKKRYVYNIYNMAGCLEGDDQDTFKLNLATFDQGFFYYENCPGFKEIDGVKVNWLEDRDCPQWLGLEGNTTLFSENKEIDNLIDSLTNDLIVPQRFYLIFLDTFRVLYYTNYEARKYFKKRVKTIYNDLKKSQEGTPPLVGENMNADKLDSMLQRYFRVEGWSESDYAFANYNVFSWGDSLLTFNQEIPLMERNWRNSMKGIYKTYKTENGYFLKIVFDKGTLKVKEDEYINHGPEGLIELTFRSVNLEYPDQIDSSFSNLELVVMNIPDSSVNLKSASSKGSQRRNLLIEKTFAMQPIFSFHFEPLSFTLEDGRKVQSMKLEKPWPKKKFKETWMIENYNLFFQDVPMDKGWWEK